MIRLLSHFFAEPLYSLFNTAALLFGRLTFRLQGLIDIILSWHVQTTEFINRGLNPLLVSFSLLVMLIVVFKQ